VIGGWNFLFDCDGVVDAVVVVGVVVGVVFAVGRQHILQSRRMYQCWVYSHKMGRCSEVDPIRDRMML